MANQVMIDMDLRHLELGRAFQQRGVSSSFESSQRAELKLADSRVSSRVMMDMDLRYLELDRAFQQCGVSSSFESSQRAELKLANSRVSSRVLAWLATRPTLCSIE